MDLFHHRIVLPTNHQTVTIIPFACIHADEDGHHEELWEECVKTIERTPLCLGIGMGDYLTLARSHYRNHIRAYRNDEDSQKQLDRLVKDRLEDFNRKYLRRIKHKLIGLAEGNHRWEFLNGTTSTQYLCELAEVPYLGFASGHRLQFVHRSGHPLQVLKMIVHHGDWSGGGMTTGGDINSLERRAEGWNADIVIAAHTHRKWGIPVPIMDFPAKGELKVVERPRAYIRAGCFVRGYVPGCVTYAERKLMKPTALGWVTLRIQFLQPYDPRKYRQSIEAGANPQTASHRSEMVYRMRVEY